MKRRWIDLITFGYFALIAYTSLVPFDFSASAPVADVPRFFGVAVTIAGLPDILSNLALYMPLGLLLRTSLARRRYTPVISAVVAIFFAAALSFAVELAQTYSLSRISSLADVCCNVIGAAIGVLVFTPESIIMRNLLRTLESEFANRTATSAAIAWTFAILFTSLAPYDLTMDVSLLLDSVKSADVIPFARTDTLLATLQSDPLNLTAASALWNTRLDYVADVLMFAILAAFVSHNARADRQPILARIATTVAVTTAIASVVTLAPVFIRSLNVDATRLLTRLTGAIPVAIIFGLRSTIQPSKLKQIQPVMLAGGAVLALAFVTARALVPFQLELHNAMTRIAAIEWIPFHSYSLTQLPAAITDIVHKSSRFFALGVLIAARRQRTGRRVQAHHLAAFTLVVAAFITILEITQLAIPGRVPATTDILVAAAATYAGLHMGRAVWSGFDGGTSHAISETSVSAVLNVPIPPPTTDEPDLAMATSGRTSDARHSQCV